MKKIKYKKYKVGTKFDEEYLHDKKAKKKISKNKTRWSVVRNEKKK